MNGSTSAICSDRDSNVANVAADVDNAVPEDGFGRSRSSSCGIESGPQVDMEEAQAESCAPAGAAWLPSVTPSSSAMSCSSSASHSGAGAYTGLHLKSAPNLRVLEFSATNTMGTMRSLSRKQLLDEARSASVPKRLRLRGSRASSAFDAVNASADSNLASDAGITARDVRKVDPMFAGHLDPLLLVRCGSITVSLGQTQLRAVILHDRFYFIVPDGGDAIISELRRNFMAIAFHNGGLLEGSPGVRALTAHCGVNELPTVNESGSAFHGTKGGEILHGRPIGVNGDQAPLPSMPLEFVALEALMMTACGELHKAQDKLRQQVGEALLSLRRTVIGTRVVAGARQLESVRELKHQVRELSVQASALQKAFETVLDQDDNMERMYLTRLHYAEAAQLSLKHAEHEEAEMLFESYMQDVASSLSSLEVVEHQIESTEKFVSFRLDSARNRLLKVDLLTTTVGAIFGFGSFIGSIFGMNLQSPLFSGSSFESGWTFNLVVGLTLGTMLGFFAALYAYFSPAFEHFGLAHVSRVR